MTQKKDKYTTSGDYIVSTNETEMNTTCHNLARELIDKLEKIESKTIEEKKISFEESLTARNLLLKLIEVVAHITMNFTTTINQYTKTDKEIEEKIYRDFPEFKGTPHIILKDDQK